METGDGSSVAATTTVASSLPWHLIPAFKPGETDISDYGRRLEFLSGMWPSEHLAQLAPRAALLCEGSAFQKLMRVPPEKLKVNNSSGVKLLVTTLGGVWGKTSLETRYEKFEKAIYGVVQRSDESNESYVARHEILFEDLVSQGVQFNDIRSYVLLRNSGLAAEDKKRVVIDSGGDLKYDQVLSSIRLLGSKFFGEVQGQNRSQKTKTYDVNYVDDPDEEPPSVPQENVFVAVDNGDLTDQVIESFAADGDEDAQLINQFEENLINLLQEDDEMTVLMSAYADARRRLAEKSRNRGFWPTSKGKGYSTSFGKGRGKGKMFSRRKSLAERIATSECKICHKRGHWKNECPLRSKEQSSSSHVANALIVENMEPDESDIIFAESLIDSCTVPAEDVYSHQGFAVLPVVHECNMVINRDTSPGYQKDNGHKNRVGQTQNLVNQFRRSLSRILKQHRGITTRESVVTPSSPESVCSPEERLGNNAKDAEKLVTTEPWISDCKSHSNHPVNFASHGTLGIVDLGASQSVMGFQQKDELLRQLPSELRQQVFESPVAMSFRFGNNGTVTCDHALMIPIGNIWLRIAVVPTVTPFLISNNVFRQLGAIIHTAKQQVHFEKLGCTVPLQLSERKLFLLDICEMARLAQHKGGLKSENIPVSKQTVLHVESEFHHTDFPVKGESTDHETPKIDKGKKNNGTSLHQDNVKSEELTCSPIKSSNATSAAQDSNPESVVNLRPHRDHHVPERSSREGVPSSEGRCSRDRCVPTVVRGTAGTSNSLRDGQTGSTLPSSSPRRSKVCQLVCQTVQPIEEASACEVHSLHRPVCGEDGDQSSDWTNTSTRASEGAEETSLPSAKGQGISQEKSGNTIGGVRGRHRMGRNLVSHDDAVCGAGCGSKQRVATSNEPDGIGSSTSCSHTAADPTGSSKVSNQSPIKTEAVYYARACFGDTGDDYPQTTSNNWVAKEMWQYILDKGFTKMPRRYIQSNQIDLLEVYCSSESQLTRQAQSCGMFAIRFGLSQGDLRYQLNRFKLYDMLIRYRPRNLWLAPSCKAWCKWAQFNSMRSPDLARKIQSLRDDEQVHLLLVDALFDFQCWRGDDCHTHCEQPAGSEMFYHEVLVKMYMKMIISRCDQCVAGKLVHPETQEPIKKGMQILTTSSILANALDKLRCSGNHQHHQIAGSCKYQGERMNLSRYTELYSAVFAKRVCRCMLASARVNEITCINDEEANHAEHQEEPENKKRRLLEKQERPLAYHPEPEESTPKIPPTIDDLLQSLIKIAPPVGKTILEGGDVFDFVQSAFPEKVIRVIEISKGVDKFRKPPIRLMPREAPLRRSFGMLRLTNTMFDENVWEPWEQLSMRQLTRKAHPARVMISVFAREKNPLLDSQASTSSNLPVIDRKRSSSDEIEGDVPSKRHQGEDRSIRKETSQEPEKSQESCYPVRVKGHGEKFLKLNPTDQQWLKKIHVNLGHPGKNKLKLALQQQPDIKKEIIEAIDDFQCDTCHEMQLPKLARPSALSNVREFNDSVGCDGVIWTARSGKQFFFYHFIDAATNFHLAHHTHQTDAEGAFVSLTETWVKWAGPCKELVVDGASSFCAEHFSIQAQKLNIVVRVVAAYAHWQLGRTERHGDILQDMLAKYDREHPIENSEQFAIALSLCCNAKNSLARARGYTPEILVLGKSSPLPGSNAQNGTDASQYLAECPSPEGLAFREQLARREAARRAFIAADNSDRIRRAILRRSRPSRGEYRNGEVVMMWRPPQGQNPGKWFGPGKVISQENESVIWISHFGRIYRTAPEHVRALSTREACDFCNDPGNQDSSLPSQIGRGVFRFEDLQGRDRTIAPPPLGNQSNGITTEIVPIPQQGNLENHNISGSQPDAEPDNSAASEPSAAEPVVESNPAEVLPPPVNPEPSEIPIPDSDIDDELCVEDYWIVQKDRVIRRHVKPRKNAFSPTGAEDCPVHPLLLSDHRETYAVNQEKVVWNHHDEWHHDSWKKNTEWTGYTIFHVIDLSSMEGEDSHPTEEESAMITVSGDQGWVCEVFLTEHDEQAMLADPDNCWAYLATVAKRQRSEVKLRDLSSSEYQEFREAQKKEINQWLETGTVRKVLRDLIPTKNIMQCRWVHTWKELDEIDRKKLGKNRKAKSRLVVMGFQDPDLEDIPRDSPTLQRDSRSLLLQLAASQCWYINSFDITTAFLRGSRRDQRKLAIEPPEEMRSHMRLKPNEICELLKSAYGLVNAPYLWYCELRDTLLSLGFVMSPLDPCLFVLPSKDPKQKCKIDGILGIHVDDGLGAGNQRYQEIISQLESIFPFGSKRAQDFTFTGIHIRQDSSFNIHLDQKGYVQDIQPISIDRDRRKKDTLTISEEERQSMRGLIGSLQYAATNTRPDICARLSFLQSKINKGCIKDLHDCNRLLADAKHHADVTITVTSLPVEDIQFVAYSDASFASRENKQSQKGCLILASHRDVAAQKETVASPLSWYSKKVNRVVASTLAAETYALSHSVDAVEWIRMSWAWIKNPHIEWRKPEEVLLQERPSIAVVDCKSLFDVINKNTTPQCSEHRTLLEALVIKDRVRTGVSLHWVHSAVQLADTLTKAMDTYSLRMFLRHHKICLHDVDEVLKDRADRRALKTWYEGNDQSSTGANDS